MKHAKSIFFIAAILASATLYQGCSKDRKNSSGTATTGGQPLAVTAALIPNVTAAAPLEVEQKAFFKFNADFKINGNQASPSASQLKWELLDSALGTISNDGIFTATPTGTLTGGLMVTYTHHDGKEYEFKFPGVIKVVVTSSTPSPPVKITINPVTHTFGFTEPKRFQVFVERQDGTTVELDENADVSLYLASLSNSAFASIDKLTVTSLATVGKSDLIIEVTMAGVTLSTTFTNAIDVVDSTPPPLPPGTDFHGFILGADDMNIITEELTMLNGTGTGQDGIGAVGKVISVSGNDATVKFTFFYGVFHGEDNSAVTLADPPKMLPGFQDGAQNNRPGSHYVAVSLGELPGSMLHVWEATFTRFPTTGTLSFTLVNSGTTFFDPTLGPRATDYVYTRGLKFDSSYNPTRGNLEFHLDPTSGEVVVGKAP